MGAPESGPQYCRLSLWSNSFLFVLVVVLVIFSGQAPRSVLFTRLRAAFRARLDLGFLSLHSPLQITRFFEAPVPSLFHNDSLSRDVQVQAAVYRLLSALCERWPGPTNPWPYHVPMPQELDVDAMLNRFRERARAVRQRGLPPIEGAERKRFMDQARTDYMDYAMIGDATATLAGRRPHPDDRPSPARPGPPAPAPPS